MTDYILGGGLAGLIWGVCHPNSTIIEKGPVGGIVSPNSTIIEKGPVGGIVSNNRGPMMIHHTLQSEEFVNNLGLDVRLKEVMVGYTYGLSHPFNIPHAGFKEEYVSHSRKVPISEITQNGHKSMMNSSQNTLLVIDLNMKELVDAMVNVFVDTGGTILKAGVSNISPRGKSLSYSNPGGFEQSVKYDSLVSTIPMHIIKRLIYRGWDSQAASCFPRWSEMKEHIMHKVFVSLKGIDGACLTEKYRGLDFVYNVPKDKDYVGSFLTRVSMGADDPVLEFTVPIDEEEYLMFLGSLEDMLLFNKVEFEITELKNSMIRRNVGIKECIGIKMVGRYAQWDHGIRLHNVIAEAMA